MAAQVTIRAAIAKNNEQIERAVGEAIGTLLRESEARVKALEAKINRLETAMAEFRFVGQWQEHKSYKAGNFVTLGAVWHANADTTSRPGTDSDWTLAVPKPRDGRDATPPEPRTVRSHR